MRLVAYTDSGGLGGAEISLGHLVAGVPDDIAPVVVGTEPEVLRAIAGRRPGTPCHLLPARGRGAFAAHRRLLRALRPDVVHVNLAVPWAAATGIAAALTLPGARVVTVDQLPLRTTALWTLLRTRELARRVDVHVAVGMASARRVEDFYVLGRGTVTSVPNCVPDVPAALRRPTDGEPTAGPVVVGSVGRLDAMKGYDVLLRAAARLPDVRVVLVGEGGERAGLDKLGAELGIADRVELVGWQAQPRRWLPAFDVFVLPSRSEGFPLAIVEAMLAGLPVVGTRVGSVAEAVVAGETGLLVDKDDVPALTAALGRLVGDPALRAAMGARGRKRAARSFTAETMVAQYVALWRQVLARPRTSRLRGVPAPP